MIWKIILILLLCMAKETTQQFPIRFWQPSQEQNHIPMPPPPPNYRFIPYDDEERVEQQRHWSLIPTRSTSRVTMAPSSSPMTTSVVTTPETTTTSSTTTTTVPSIPRSHSNPCEYFDETALMNKLKQQGLFNAIYMAPDVFTAAKTFPDLGDKTFTISGDHKYECDEQCERESKLFRKVISSNTRHSVRRRPNFRQSPKVSEAPRSWWRPANWRREKRDNDLENISPILSPQPPLHREKRSAADLIQLNSGKTEGIIGTTIALQCDEATTEEVPSNGYHLCRNCRAVRHLPETYFPRVLNEVICAEGSCFRNDGKCQQRYLPFRILHNVGSSRCPQWREVDVQIRTCCDCVIHPNSPFLKYIIPED